MANENKFLDAIGVQHLWSKISMEDYPNNETLIAVINAIDESKQNIPAYINTSVTSLTLEDNTEYRLTDVSSLTLYYPEENFEVWMKLSFSSIETINVIFPIETKYIGAAPTFNNSETWEISIKDGVAICWRIE